MKAEINSKNHILIFSCGKFCEIMNIMWCTLLKIPKNENHKIKGYNYHLDVRSITTFHSLTAVSLQQASLLLSQCCSSSSILHPSLCWARAIGTEDGSTTDLHTRLTCLCLPSHQEGQWLFSGWPQYEILPLDQCNWNLLPKNGKWENNSIANWIIESKRLTTVA